MFDKKVYMSRYLKEYAEENKESLSAYKLAWKKEKLNDPEYRQHQNNLQKIRRAKNGVNEDQAEKSRIRAKIWQSKNKAKVLANVKKYKLSKINRTPSWLTESDHKVIWGFYEIAAMLTKHNGEQWEVDHKIPLNGKAVSGLHVPSNLQLMRSLDNRSKSNKFEVQ
jgi:hypothetical protein